MVDDFWFYLEYGVKHVLDINGYDHVLFLMLLAVPYLFKNWRRVLILVSNFTLGHTISLLLAAYGVVTMKDSLVEFLIPLTILILAVYNVFTAGKNEKDKNINLVFISTLFFGLIHGLGFAREFKILVDRTENKLIPLLEFALGIEIAQVIIVFVVLFVGFLFQTVFRLSRRDWIMVVSAIVIGLVIPMLFTSDFLS
ncbi:MAG: HupE/UreJ family protein [Flavobacteriaceae bacterium]|nr:HupE/UreJ family protein [Flavobacteriaceae bacterium]